MKITAALAALLLLAGCGRKTTEETVPKDGWMLSLWGGSSELAGKIYLQLFEDGNFVLYQHIDTPGFQKFTGTYTITRQADPSTGAVLREVMGGRYSDGAAWADDYEMLGRTDSELTLRSVGEQETSVYVRVVVPDYVKDGVTQVRTAVGKPFL